MKNYVNYMLLLIIATLFIGALVDIFVAFAVFIVASAYGLILEKMEEL